MTKHRYDFRTAKTDHRWSVYFTDHLNEEEKPGSEKFYHDHDGGFYCTYFGPVEVNEIYRYGKLVGHEEVEMEKTYKIIRLYQSGGQRKVLKTGLSLAEAQAHCKDDETSSDTCSTLEGIEHTRIHGKWFDAFEGE